MADSDIARYGKKIVNYFWDPLPRNLDTTGTPIFCLGLAYDSHPQPTLDLSQSSATSPSDSTASRSYEGTSEIEEISKSEIERELISQDSITDRNDEGGWPPAFLDDFESRIWFTYRSNFTPISKSQDPKALAAMSFAVRLRQLASQEGFTSDTGWGCMIRTGQSLLANALIFLHFGREWRHGQNDKEERQLISLFADNPKAPFSIHKFVEHGASACGKHPGEWFGPSATAMCIQALANKHSESNLAVYITGDGSNVFEDAVYKVAKAKTGSFGPTLILVGTRLGIDRITPVYSEALKKTLQISQSIGIAGGRPSSSHYFVGTQGSDFFYLDPHQTRLALPLHENVDDYTEEEIGMCHTRRLRRINIREMDPSMLIGFLIRDEDDWKKWREAVSTVPGKPIVHVTDKEPVYASVTKERPEAIDEIETFDTEDDEI